MILHTVIVYLKTIQTVTLSVRFNFELLKTPELKLQYGDLKAAVGDELTAENLQRQVIHIRQAKLPRS